ncbi:aldose epimerase family protein [Candidatus Sororendozoicomonas aggregata]|uniref:aldose epimerase family protein n=1 Tax=Candidatus Sororendozoicomonas aggregata TaxID=3073239 RepID=UPI002ED2C069
MNISQDVFGKSRFNETVNRYTLNNSHGTQVAILNLGGIIQSLFTRDKQGKLSDIVLGCNTVAGYEEQQAYLGAIAGRFANRISNGQLTINGKDYQLARNNGKHHLHGGHKGFNSCLWSAATKQQSNAVTVTLTYLSKEGEEGYPGNLKLQVSYTLNERNELHIDYQATTDAITVVNLTNHSYFNLRGYGSCLNHQLELRADHYLPTDATAIPTGELAPVKGTPMDFRITKALGRDIDKADQQLLQAKGYDHCWVFAQADERPIKPQQFAIVSEPEHGRRMEVFTTHPGVQLYSGNYLDGTPSKSGQCYRNWEGFCLETQHFPDSPNHPHFPSTLLHPQETYSHQTIFRFS